MIVKVYGKSETPHQMKRNAQLLACLALCPAILEATSINFSGTETNEAVTNWSNTSIAKSRDVNGDDRFGGAGYYQITPTEYVEIWGEDVGLNDLGITQLYPTQFIKPAFLSADPVGESGSFYNAESFPKFKDPTGAVDLQQGVLWLNSESSTAGTIVDGISNIPGIRSKAFSFSLSEAASFRLGVATDVMNINSFTPDYISVSNVITGERFSTALTRDGTADMAFFDISGDAGDEFEVALWQTNDNGSGNRVAFALVTFDKIPPPTLTYELSGGNILLSWGPEITGWILESSTTLGVPDSWDPVPGVVNNSVSLPMTGVPKNFFRLRKDP